LGTAIAFSNEGVFNGWYFLLAFIAGIFMHIGANVINDYFDYKGGSDNINVEFTRPFTGGSRMIQEGLMTPREVFIEAMVFFALGGLIGVYLAFETGYMILVLGIIGAFSGFFYSAPPVSLVNRGIGELFIGLNFGILMTLGGYYVQVQHLAWEPALAAVPLGIMIANVLYINEFPDYKADRDSGKNHLVVRLGKAKAAKGHAVITASAYISIGIFVAFGWVSPYALVMFLTLPLAITSIRYSRDFYSDSFRIIPANASTIQVHMIIGILMTLGYLLAASPQETWLIFLILVVVGGLLMFKISEGLEKARDAPPPAKAEA
jgi:1,4-dihydroxy-2-naphthoate octaprenyltransferase